MDTLQTLKIACDEVLSPLQRLEHSISPYITFGVIPLFVLANAGIEFSESIIASFTKPVSLGIFFGLVIGKPLGIIIFSQIPLKAGIASYRRGMNIATLSALVLLQE